MFHDSDCDFFQDLVQWCVPTRDEVVQSDDSQKTVTMTDILHTSISTQSWDYLDGNSSSTQAGLYNPTSKYPITPTYHNMDGFFNMEFFDPIHLINENKVPFLEQSLATNNSSVAMTTGYSASEAINMNPRQPPPPESIAGYTKTMTDLHDTLSVHQPSSLDIKNLSVTSPDAERKNYTSEYNIMNDDRRLGCVQIESQTKSSFGEWFVNIPTVPTQDQFWPADVCTSYVERLAKEKLRVPSSDWHCELGLTVAETKRDNPSFDIYGPITPKSVSTDNIKSSNNRRLQVWEDSNKIYPAYIGHSPQKYNRRKPKTQLIDMIRVLEGSHQLTRARRGRPPKRRETAVSSPTIVSTHELKYRDLRDKNNEASKRSRMCRKYKELQMEELVEELEKRNKKLRKRADMLEDMIKRLRETFMTAVSQNKPLKS